MQLTLEDLRKLLKRPDGVQLLCDLGATENEYLDFKRDNYWASGANPTDEKRADFLKDATAFANARGGYLIIGVDEDQISRHTTLCGIEDDPKIEERVGAWLSGDTHITPRIVGFSIERYQVTAGRIAVAVFIQGRPANIVHACKAIKPKKFKKGKPNETPAKTAEQEGSKERWVSYVRLHNRIMELSPEEAKIHRTRPPSLEYFRRPHPLLHWSTILIPNILTMSRPPLGATAAIAICLGQPTLAAIAYVAGLLTDVLDGALARALNGTTEWGKKWDRIADMAFNSVSGAGVAMAALWVYRARTTLLVAITLLGAIAISRIWIQPHSAMSKVRSGAIRVVLVMLFLSWVPQEHRTLLTVSTIALLIIAGVYESVLLQREVDAGQRGWWKNCPRTPVDEAEKTSADDGIVR